MSAILALLVITAVSLVVIRVGTLALIRTGLSRDAAGFQALSAFFGVGFTTHEAEMVVNHPVRRRIIRHLILIGNLGVLSAVGLIVAGFLPTEAAVQHPDEVPRWAIKLVVVVVGLGVLWFVATRQFVCRLVDHTIAAALKRGGVVRAMDYDLLLRVAYGYCVSEVEIDPGHEMAGRTLAETRLRQQGVIVLGVARDDGAYVGAPNGQTEIRAGDVLTVYGREQDVRTALHLSGPPDVSSDGAAPDAGGPPGASGTESPAQRYTKQP